MKRNRLSSSFLICAGLSSFGAGLLLICGFPAIAKGETQRDEPQSDAGMIRVDGFLIDQYEYPNVKGALPRVNVTWDEAQSLCQATGKRLCSENEWERACRGPEGYLYGYGQTFEPGRCHTPKKVDDQWLRGPDRAPSGTFSGCLSPGGASDMIGNVWEWTDALSSPTKDWHVVRGGSWFHNVNLARADARYGRFLDSGFKLDLIGLRCCRSVVESEPADSSSTPAPYGGDAKSAN
jgi:formylglycine-generating enzyme required for sulfatase activity